jgi:hypothetical protein
MVDSSPSLRRHVPEDWTGDEYRLANLKYPVYQYLLNGIYSDYLSV